MKRKILSYLLIGLFALFIGGSFIYVDAKGEGGINPDLVGGDGGDGGGSSDRGGGGSPAGSKGNGIAPDLNGDSAGGGTSTTTQQSSTKQPRKCGDPCDGVKLNTCFPIIGDCIEAKKGSSTDPTNAFPTMLAALTKIIMSVILVVCFILVIYAGILWSMDKPKDAKKWLERVAVTIILLGLSGVILKLVNPNFFS